MKIIYNKKIVEYENNKNKINDIFKMINDQLEADQLSLLHLVIDGLVVKENYYDYFLKNIETIQRVEIVAEDLGTLVKETLRSTSEYLANAVFQTKPLADAFYQIPKQETWSNLADLLEGIGWLFETIENIDKIKNLNQMLNNYESWNCYVIAMRELITVMPELEDAMNHKDQVLIGDLLYYEVFPVFEKAQQNLNNLVSLEGDSYVS